jgi:hypothetical protein
MQQQPVTDAELVDVLARRLHKIRQPPPPSQSFTVHDDDRIFQSHPSELYGTSEIDSVITCTEQIFLVLPGFPAI